MLGKNRLIVDTFSEVSDYLRPWIDREFWEFANETIIPNAIYVIGRAQSNLNFEKIQKIVESGEARVILSNPAEGSETIKWQIFRVGYSDYIKQGRMLMISGGDIEPEYHNLPFDSFLGKPYDYDENLESIKRTPKIFDTVEKPYKFLFLNGRARPNRKFLLESFRLSGLLDQTIWTNLDLFAGKKQEIEIIQDGEDLMLRTFPIKYLDAKYEVERYHENLSRQPTGTYAKLDLFSNGRSADWGEIYIKPDMYIDTYFSLVTETVFCYPYSFRTEKIWKPIAMGHPWIAAANAGYYRDMHALGFRTFGHIIDESFDGIDNDFERIKRIRDIVEDLCSSQTNLVDFLSAAREVCEYNQRHLWTMRAQVRNEFGERFRQFLKLNNFIDE